MTVQLNKDIELKETSKERVLSFLNLTKDSNPVHQFEKWIFPGMFYLALAAKHFPRQLKSLCVDFKETIKYPFECSMHQQSQEDSTKISFRKNGISLCNIRATFFQEPARTDYSGLEKFAYILGVSEDDCNLRHLWLACCIPGKLGKFLQKEKGAKAGIYKKQTLKFGDLLPPNPQLEISVRSIKGKLYQLRTDYYAPDRNVLVRGRALVYPLGIKKTRTAAPTQSPMQQQEL